MDKTRIQIIYLGGPYRASTEWQLHNNIIAADNIGRHIVLMGAMPLIPHKNCELMGGLQNDQFFIDGTLELLKRCDAMLVIPDSKWKESQGTLGEITCAREMKIPIFYTLEDLKTWLTNKKEEEELPWYKKFK